MARTHEAIAIERNRTHLLQNLDDQFLVCREKGHAWEDDISYVSEKRRGRAWEVTEISRCTRCDMERRDRLHARTWELIGRVYVQPDGYAMPNSGWTGRAHVRQEKFRRRPPLDALPER